MIFIYLKVCSNFAYELPKAATAQRFFVPEGGPDYALWTAQDFALRSHYYESGTITAEGKVVRALTKTGERRRWGGSLVGSGASVRCKGGS
jgi:hypothetical protein